MMLNKCFLGLFAIGMFTHSDGVFFRSEALANVTLHAVEGDYGILDDEGNKVEVTALEDQHGVAYWHRRIKTEVCQTGECKLVDVGLYWDCTGDFYGLEVYGEHLTKTDHTIFLREDYDRLVSILSNDWSILREYDFNDLTETTLSVGSIDVGTNNKEVDATSGATRKEIASEAVEDAVYTTYTLWHLIHAGEKEQLEELTVERLKTGSLAANLLKAPNKKYDYFLLSLLTQSRIQPSEPLNLLILRGLGSANDLLLQDLAVKSLAHAQIYSPSFQADMAAVYEHSSPGLKLRMLTALKNITQIHSRLGSALERDLNVNNEWLAMKILPLLMRGQAPSDSTVQTVRRLAESKNMQLKGLANEFLKILD